MFYQIIPTRLFQKKFDAGILTYSATTNFKIGQIVHIPLGRSSTIGIIIDKTTKKPDFPVKNILEALYSTPLPAHIIKSILWLSSYYLIPLPSVANLFLPLGITKKRRQILKIPHHSTSITSTPPTIPLNSHQKAALKKIEQTKSRTKLLHGITGSGKTNIYLHLAKKAIQNQQSVVLLVPEIALTSQLVQIFSQAFKDQVNLIHSNQTESYRHQNWQQILESTSPSIIIGPRSALLAPVKNLGLIIIDESHESTYFQENSPKYSSLRLASFIANSLKITCLQGSATPLITDYYLAKTNNSLITLDQKAKSTAIEPSIHLIDLTDRQNFTTNRYFSDQLLSQIKQNLKNHHQTLIFHNRRGSAPLTICENCGWQALCPTCFLPLTLHIDSYNLLCHACGYQTKVPNNCPSCNRLGVIHKGFGTKLLESELKKLFPTASIARFDADNTKSETLNEAYKQVKSGAIDILIGTQILTKGLDLPHLDTVGIVQADSGLSLPDFLSEERTFQLITQVIGRTGRGHLDTANVFIQTYQSSHPVIQYATKSDYLSLFDYLEKKRAQSLLPPFTFLAILSITYKTESTTVKKIKEIYQALNKFKNLKVSQPTPAFHERSLSGFTWQLTIKSKTRSSLIAAITSFNPSTNLKFTIDPPSLI